MATEPTVPEIVVGDVLCLENGIGDKYRVTNIDGERVQLQAVSVDKYLTTLSEIKNWLERGIYVVEKLTHGPTIKRYVVTAVDHDADGNCDGKARTLGVFTNKAAAEEYVKKDMDDYVKSESSDDEDEPKPVVDYAIKHVWDCDGVRGCEWNIEEITIEL